jgi:hypothetical protein
MTGALPPPIEFIPCGEIYGARESDLIHAALSDFVDITFSPDDHLRINVSQGRTQGSAKSPRNCLEIVENRLALMRVSAVK